MIRLGTQFFADDMGSESGGLDGDGFEFDFSDDDFADEVGTLADADSEPIETAPAQQTAQAQLTELAGSEPQADTTSQLYTVKYNGEEKQLPIEELITNAQKGMNYDKVYEEREALKSSREFALLDKLAQANGLSREQYVERVIEQQHQMEIESQIKSGVPPEVAERLYSLEQAEKQRIQATKDTEKQQAETKAYTEFAAAYPEVKEFPPEVIAEIGAGVSPLNAYMAYENKQMKQRLQAFEKNEQNAKSSTGSLVGTRDDVAQDAFMSGFSGAF